MKQSMKKWALYYASLGLSVFPLIAREKRPSTENGCKAATTDVKTIKEWWDRHPDSNIGIATGAISGGLVVIDLDVDENKGIDGYEVLKDWQHKHGELPDTWMSITGRGGYHLFYKDDAANKNRVGLYEGVDIRGEGGYIVAPPSIHPNGNRYEWEQAPNEYKLAQADDNVRMFIMGSMPEKSQEQTFTEPEVIHEGERVSSLIRLIGSLKAKGLGNEAIISAVKSENASKCIPPLSKQELDKNVFPAISRGWEPSASYVCDHGKTRKIKKPLSPILLPAADVEIREPEWLIHGYIPKNGITIIAGEGGVGKTSIWCNIVAAVTSGKQSFMEHDIPYGGVPQNVVVFSAEDSWEYVLKQRLINNGADLNRISFLSPADERFSELNFNGEFLKEIIETNRPPLIIFDPVQAFVPENLKMGDRNAMRKCFAPLMGYGETYNLTSIIVAHANKQGNVWGRKRLADSSDIWDASRSVLMVGTTKDNIRYIAHEKSNWGKLQESVLFELNNGVPTFKAYTNKKDKDFILSDQYNNRTAPALEEAKEFILDFLKDGQKEVSELDEMAKVDGISKNALKDAKAALKREGETRTWSIGYGKDKKYFICLSESSLTATEKPTSKKKS